MIAASVFYALLISL